MVIEAHTQICIREMCGLSLVVINVICSKSIGLMIGLGGKVGGLALELRE